jgi:thiamine phosphate synthase YjbQ (UPF0047 family)
MKTLSKQKTAKVVTPELKKKIKKDLETYFNSLSPAAKKDLENLGYKLDNLRIRKEYQ